MQIMLDLETLGTAHNSRIISIGAVKFNKEGLHDAFYECIDLKNEPDSRFKIDEGAIEFWLKQPKAAQEMLFIEPKPIFLVLKRFSEFASGCKGMWGNGVSFDNVILRNAYETLNIPVPWHYRVDRCFRTIKGLYKHLKIEWESVGVKHNALDDAKTQALYLLKLPIKEGLI